MEDDGEIDYDFSCLDPSEPISKFEFTVLGLTELSKNDAALFGNANVEKSEVKQREDDKERNKDHDTMAEDMAKMEGHAVAMEAPMYQLYR